MSDCEDNDTPGVEADALEDPGLYLEDMLDDALQALTDVLEALAASWQTQTDVTTAHLRLVCAAARRLLARPDITAFQWIMAPPDEARFLLGELVVDYLATTDDPNQYFGPGAPDQGATLMAAVRWGVSEGRLTLADAERIQTQLVRIAQEVPDAQAP